MTSRWGWVRAKRPRRPRPTPGRQLALDPVEDVPDVHGLLDHPVARGPGAPASRHGRSSARCCCSTRPPPPPGLRALPDGSVPPPRDTSGSTDAGSRRAPPVPGPSPRRGQVDRTRPGRAQRLLGVQVLPAASRRHRAARAGRRARRSTTASTSVRSSSRRVLVGLGSMAAGLLGDPLATQPVLGFGVADARRPTPRQLQRPEAAWSPDCRCRSSYPDRGRRTVHPRRLGRLPCVSASPAAAEQPRNRRRFTKWGAWDKLHQCSRGEPRVAFPTNGLAPMILYSAASRPPSERSRSNKHIVLPHRKEALSAARDH